MKLKQLFILVLAASISGCCTMKNGPRQFVEVNSKPDGATVRAGDQTATTPALVSLRRGQNCVVQLEKQGYKSVYVPLTSQTSNEMWWRNLIWIHPIGWVVGWIVDGSSGCGHELNPSSVNVTLVPVQ